MAKLTATKIKAFPYKGRYGDGDGLFLNVTATGTKSWVQRVVVHGRQRDIGLGGYPAVSLAEARQRCTDNRKAIAAGLDPIAEKRKPTVATFREAAEIVHEMNIPRWRSAKHAKSWLRMLERYASSPSLATRPSTGLTAPTCWRFSSQYGRQSRRPRARSGREREWSFAGLCRTALSTTIRLGK